MKIGSLGVVAVVCGFAMVAHAGGIAEETFGLMSIDFPEVIRLEPFDERITDDAQVNQWFGASAPDNERGVGVIGPELARLLVAVSVSRVMRVAENTVAQLQEASRYQDKLADVIRRSLSGTAVLNGISTEKETAQYARLALDALRERRVLGDTQISELTSAVTNLWNALPMERRTGVDTVAESSVPGERTAPVVGEPYETMLFLPVPDAGDEFNPLAAGKWLGKEPRYRVIPFRAARLKHLHRLVGSVRMPVRDGRLSERQYVELCLQKNTENLKAIGWVLYRLALAEALLADDSDLIRGVDVLDGIKPLLDARIEHAERLRLSLSAEIGGTLSSYSDRGISSDRAQQAVAGLNAVLKTLRASKATLDELTSKSGELKSWRSRAKAVPNVGAKRSGLEQDISNHLREVRGRWMSTLNQVEPLN